MERAEALAVVASYPRRRVPRDVREGQILALAEQLFAERGYDGASMEELARRAGVSKPIVYDLIGKKEEIYRRTFETAAAELGERVALAAGAETGDMEATLRAGALAFFEFIDQHRDAWTMLSTDPSGGKLATYVDQIRVNQTRFTAQL